MVPETPGNTSPCAVSGSEHQRSRRGFPIGAGDIRSGGSPARPSVHAPRHRTADPHPVPSTGRQQNPASRPKSDDRRSRKEAPSARRFLISSPWSWVISSIGRSGCNPNPTGERPWPPSNPRGLRLSYARGSTQSALTSELHHVRGHYPGIALGGGLRKVRIPREGGGKSGGFRTIYVFGGTHMPIFLITVFAKNEKGNLSKAEQAAAVELSKRIVAAYGDPK